MSQSVKPLEPHQAHDPFSDPVHFKTEVGGMILSTVLQCETATPPSVEFGLKLDRERILAHLAEERRKLDDYANAHPQLVEIVAATIREKRRKSE